MIRTLRIENMMLIEKGEISFDSGFTVITGETGAGKSAILNSLGLLAGKKGDTSFIRQGASGAKVEALVEVKDSATIAFLEEIGIACEEELIIRRELTGEGKSRAFLNDRAVTLATLKDLAGLLFQFVGQQASQILAEPRYHLATVDLFGGISLTEYQETYKEIQTLRQELEALKIGEGERLRELEICARELEEITGAAIQEGEDDTLFAEYSRLTTVEEWLALANGVSGVLEGGVLDAMQSVHAPFRNLASLDPEAARLLETFEETTLEIKEIAHELARAIGRREINPARLQEVNDRLAILHRLKKRYGASYDKIVEYEKGTREKLHRLENADVRIEEIEKEVKAKQSALETIAAEIAKQRKKAGKQLEKEVHHHLQELNMKGALFRVAIEPCALSLTAGDKIEFMIAPNVGEKEVPVRERASGGEQSRLMLSLQTILAGKEKIPTIIFDEIDSNIGGQTATAVAKKLQHIGKKHQVFSVTHFPQVARMADHHLRISKYTEGNRTYTRVETLDPKGREEEAERMMGLTVLATVSC